MKRYFTTLLDVFQNVIAFCTSTDGAPVTNSIPALQSGINTTLTGKVNTILGFISAQKKLIKGYATQKKTYKNEAARVAMIVINGSKSYARSVNDEPLLGQIKYSYTKLRTIKDDEFASVVTGLMTLLSPLQTQLLNFGVTAQSFTDVGTAVNTYITFLTAPRQEVVSKKAVNDTLAILFKDTNDFLITIIDPIVLTLKDSQSLYYLSYRTARKHVPHGLRHNRINAVVVNDLNEPFVGVQVTVDEYLDPDTQKTYPAVSSNTDINGMVTVEEFWPGNRTVTISGQGIVTKTFGPYDFKNGKGVTETFTCEPAFNNLPAPKTTTEEEKVSK